MTEQEKRVLDLIDSRKDDVVHYLSRLIRFRTVTPQDHARVKVDEFRKHQEFVRGTLEELGLKTETWEVEVAKLESFPGSGVIKERDLGNQPVVVGTRGGNGRGKSLILNGHYDVVPPGLRESWTHDPFEPVIHDGRLYGRGACDMKGGIAAMIQAVRFIREAGVKLSGDLTVQVVPDEEMTCMGTLSCCQRGYRADAAIIPEPTDMKVLIAMRGGSGGKITVHGWAGHAELTQPHWSRGGAVNAISKAVKILLGLEELSEEWRTRPDKQHKYLDPDTIVPTIIKGGEWEVTYPEKVEIWFDAVFVPTTKNLQEEIQEKVRSVANMDPWMRKNPPELHFGEWLYGAEVGEEEPIVQAARAALEELGLEPGLKGFGSLTDAVHLINRSKIPTISIGPNSQPAHMADEFVEIGELVNTTKVMALLIMRWCG